MVSGSALSERPRATLDIAGYSECTQLSLSFVTNSPLPLRGGGARIRVMVPRTFQAVETSRVTGVMIGDEEHRAQTLGEAAVPEEGDGSGKEEEDSGDVRDLRMRRGARGASAQPTSPRPPRQPGATEEPPRGLAESSLDVSAGDSLATVASSSMSEVVPSSSIPSLSEGSLGSGAANPRVSDKGAGKGGEETLAKVFAPLPPRSLRLDVLGV